MGLHRACVWESPLGGLLRIGSSCRRGGTDRPVLEVGRALLQVLLVRTQVRQRREALAALGGEERRAQRIARPLPERQHQSVFAAEDRPQHQIEP